MDKFPGTDAVAVEQVTVLAKARDSSVNATFNTADTSLVTAEPIKRIINKETGFLVGWLYRWSNGQVMPRWESGAYGNVRYEDFGFDR